jgi:hypothetical protein
MITVKHNFFDQKLLADIFACVKDSVGRPKWSTNLSWDETIVKGAGQVSILPLEELDSAIKRKYLESWPHLEKAVFRGHFYIWLRGSHIPWHTDELYELGSTVYMNKTWDIDDGGLFLWMDEESKRIHAEVPEYNKAVVNMNKTPHAVSMLSNQAQNVRMTVQVFAFPDASAAQAFARKV